MAKFKFKVTTNVDGYFSAKVTGDLTDVDVGKPVKLYTSAPDTYALCSDGDQIEGFIVAIDPSTADGLHFCTINNQNRQRVEADGALTIGGLVEAAANAAAGTANTNKLPLVSAKAAIAADLAVDASGTLIAASVNALLADAIDGAGRINWRVISGDTTDGDVADEDQTVIIERI